MLRILLLLVLLILPKIVFSQESTARLLKQLDQVLDQQEIYSNQKESRIHSLRNQITPSSSQLQKEAIYHQLFDEYRVYKSDSALVYARKKVSIANKLNNLQKIQEANLDLTSIMGTLGMYKEAMDVLSTIKLENKSALKGTYYNNNRSIYSYMADYASSDYEKKQYLDWVQKYRDSALVYIKKPSSDYTINLAESLIEKRKYEQALKELTIPYKNLKANDPNRAVFAYIISTIYQKQGKIEEQKKWLILSAMSDLELYKKENISLRNLAFLLYEQG
ncbi:hypothetical protein, partial [Flavobacterium sp.]|uniref:hypothetical protein n=1 Tax=Flavobacterium sp. TaxID=239 RepID=UPI00261A530F